MKAPHSLSAGEGQGWHIYHTHPHRSDLDTQLCVCSGRVCSLMSGQVKLHLCDVPHSNAHFPVCFIFGERVRAYMALHMSPEQECPQFKTPVSMIHMCLRSLQEMQLKILTLLRFMGCVATEGHLSSEWKYGRF